MQIQTEEDDMTDEKALPQPGRMSEEEFLRRLHEIVPEGARAVSARQAAQIWNLRAEREGKTARYNVYSVHGKLRDSVKSGNLHKLTPAQQRSVLGAVIRHYTFLWLDEVLKIPLTPGQSTPKPKGTQSQAYKLLDDFMARHADSLDQVHGYYSSPAYREYVRESEEQGIPPLTSKTFSRVLAQYRKAAQAEQRVEEEE